MDSYLVAGNSRWVHAMKWSGQRSFVGSPTVPFSVNGSEAGEMQSYGPLVFLKVSLAIRSLHLYDYLIELHNLNRIFLLKQVYNAGHLVPMDRS